MPSTCCAISYICILTCITLHLNPNYRTLERMKLSHPDSHTRKRQTDKSQLHSFDEGFLYESAKSCLIFFSGNCLGTKYLATIAGVRLMDLDPSHPAAYHMSPFARVASGRQAVKASDHIAHKKSPRLCPTDLLYGHLYFVGAS